MTVVVPRGRIIKATNHTALKQAVDVIVRQMNFAGMSHRSGQRHFGRNSRSVLYLFAYSSLCLHQDCCTN